MGHFNFYRRFIPGFAKITKPITDLTQENPVAKGKNIPITWTQEADTALQRLKEATRDHAVLSFPNFEQPFFIHCDASDKAIGGCIFQLDKKNHLRPVCFYSRTLSGSESRYACIDREALAIHQILETQKSWLLGFQIVILSNHLPLKFILEDSPNSTRLVR